MLTPEQIDALRDKAGHITDPITEFLLEDIARRVSEAGQLTSTAAYQVWRAQQLGMSQKEVKAKLRKLLKKSKKEVNQLLTQAAEVGYRYDLERLPTSAAIPFEKNGSIQQIVSAAVKLAQDDLTNITQTIGMVDPFGNALPLQDAYRAATDFAFEQVITGATDYNTAIRRATKNLAEKGIQWIDYESGVHTSLEAAVRRNIMGGLGLMNEQINEANHDALGCDGWEISAHANSAPDHEPLQGKQYPDKEYQALNNSLLRRIGTLNCGHVAFPIIMGVNEPQYTKEQLEKFRTDNEKGVTIDGKHYTGYEATQVQRKLERAIRKQKRRVLVDESMGDKDKLLTDQIKLQTYKQQYARFSKAAGLRMENERAQVAGFGRGQAARAVADVKANEKHIRWLKDIGAENTKLNTIAKYREAKYNNSSEYRLLTGYGRAVGKGDISPLVGFEQYLKTNTELHEQVVGLTTATGLKIESFATHFIDRVIGQTSTDHEGLRCGVPVEDVVDALLNPEKIKEPKSMADGDIRQTLNGRKCTVTLSVRDKRLIQTNPRRG